LRAASFGHLSGKGMVGCCVGAGGVGGLRGVELAGPGGWHCWPLKGAVLGLRPGMLSDELVKRRLSPAAEAALEASPVTAITGPRTAGKSTLARQIADATGGTLLDLEDPAVRRLAAGDPSAFVRGLAEPVVPGGVQRGPELRAAIKAERKWDRRPGRYVLTGSARHDVVPELAEYLTGRVELLTLWPFAAAELNGGATSVVDRLFDGSILA